MGNLKGKIIIEWGETYAVLERIRQCRVTMPGRPPFICSHDYDMEKAITNAVRYLQLVREGKID